MIESADVPPWIQKMFDDMQRNHKSEKKALIDQITKLQEQIDVLSTRLAAVLQSPESPTAATTTTEEEMIEDYQSSTKRKYTISTDDDANEEESYTEVQQKQENAASKKGRGKKKKKTNIPAPTIRDPSPVAGLSGLQKPTETQQEKEKPITNKETKKKTATTHNSTEEYRLFNGCKHSSRTQHQHSCIRVTGHKNIYERRKRFPAFP